MALHGRRLTRSEDFPVATEVKRLAFCLSWEFLAGVKEVDMDIQCVVVNSAGHICDACYYNNMKALGRAITHSGDSLDGKDPDVDEKITVHLDRLGQDVSLLVFVVCCFSGGTFANVLQGMFRVVDEATYSATGTKPTLAQYKLSDKGNHTADILCVMHRHNAAGQWKVRTIDQVLQGAHFMDILNPIQETIRIFIPTAPKRQKLAFSMRKGNVFDFASSQSAVICALGWDTTMGEVDLDASCVLLDKNGQMIESVFFGNLESKRHGIIHSGDNLTGEGEGDDEQITCYLDRVGPEVACLYFCINIYSPNRTFRQVANPYARVVDPNTGDEYCRYQLSDAGMSSGLIIARLQRDKTNRWGFHALGVPANGRLYKDCLPEMQRLLSVETRNLYQRGHTMELHQQNPGIVAMPTQLGGGGAGSVVMVTHMPGGQAGLATAPPPPAQAPGPDKQNKCCVIQ